jgi:NTE family protein
MGEAAPDLFEPVRRLPGESTQKPKRHTSALCLSGGGYRAMLFHVGVLWRLNEAGWLPRLNRISSVSGGSITAAALAIAWDQLNFDALGRSPVFTDRVAEPLLKVAKQTIDRRAGLVGIALPLLSISHRVASQYREHLLGDAKLSDLPEKPSFVFNATNLETGNLFRFTKHYLADWQLGKADSDAVDLATAVACSSAFPPVLSPFKLDLRNAKWLPAARTAGAGDGVTTASAKPLTDLDFRKEITLSDGGVYDNLGLETVWKQHHTVLVSDAGGHLAADPNPPTDWPRQTLRVLKVVDNQVRTFRKLQVIRSLENKTRDGLYLGIRSDPANYKLEDRIPVGDSARNALAEIPTRLAPPAGNDALRLINWGYALCDTGLRSHLGETVKGSLPYPDAPLA